MLPRARGMPRALSRTGLGHRVHHPTAAWLSGRRVGTLRQRCRRPVSLLQGDTVELRSIRRPGWGLDLCVHHFRDSGAKPTGLTVLCLHGFADGGRTWDSTAAHLVRAGHEVVAPDLRGFGESDPVGRGGYYHFPDYVADVARLVDDLAPERLAVVGHSMGGTVATLFTGARPNRVERLALLEGIGPPEAEPAAAVDRMQAWLRDLAKAERIQRPLESMDDAVDRLSRTHPGLPREILTSRAELLVRRSPSGELAWAYDPLHRTRSPTPFNAGAFHAFLAAITCPTLFVSGGPSGWHPPEEAERIATLRRCTARELPGAGHMMHWTAPAELAAMLVEHFA